MRIIRIGVLVFTLGLGACAGAGQSPTIADSLFPLPYLIKQQRAHPLPPYGTRVSPAPVTSERKP